MWDQKGSRWASKIGLFHLLPMGKTLGVDVGIGGSNL